MKNNWRLHRYVGGTYRPFNYKFDGLLPTEIMFVREEQKDYLPSTMIDYTEVFAMSAKEAKRLYIKKLLVGES